MNAREKITRAIYEAVNRRTAESYVSRALELEDIELGEVRRRELVEEAMRLMWERRRDKRKSL